VFLVDDATPLREACRRHGLDFRYERHGNRNSAERVFREIRRRTDSFSNCFSHVDLTTADDWLRSFALAWNQLIRTPMETLLIEQTTAGDKMIT